MAKKDTKTKDTEVTFDPNVDYSKAIDDAIAGGADVKVVQGLQAQRNAKIAANESTLGQYKYNDTNTKVNDYSMNNYGNSTANALNDTQVQDEITARNRAAAAGLSFDDYDRQTGYSSRWILGDKEYNDNADRVTRNSTQDNFSKTNEQLFIDQGFVPVRMRTEDGIEITAYSDPVTNKTYDVRTGQPVAAGNTVYDNYGNAYTKNADGTTTSYKGYSEEYLQKNGIKVQCVGPDGIPYIGYSIDGKTYDPRSGSRVSSGTHVQASNGQWYTMTDGADYGLASTYDPYGDSPVNRGMDAAEKMLGLGANDLDINTVTQVLKEMGIPDINSFIQNYKNAADQEYLLDQNSLDRLTAETKRAIQQAEEDNMREQNGIMANANIAGGSYGATQSDLIASLLAYMQQMSATENDANKQRQELDEEHNLNIAQAVNNAINDYGTNYATPTYEAITNRANSQNYLAEVIANYIVGNAQADAQIQASKNYNAGTTKGTDYESDSLKAAKAFVKDYMGKYYASSDQDALNSIAAMIAQGYYSDAPDTPDEYNVKKILDKQITKSGLYQNTWGPY